jgi:hypothetical protein
MCNFTLNWYYALQNEKSCKGGFIQTLGNKRKISKKTRPYDGLGIDCVSPNIVKVFGRSLFNSSVSYLPQGFDPIQHALSPIKVFKPGFGDCGVFFEVFLEYCFNDRLGALGSGICQIFCVLLFSQVGLSS